MEFQLSYLKLKDDALKVLHTLYQQIWKAKQWPQDWKRSVFLPIPKKGNTKERSNYCTTAFISHAIKVMLKILQARFQWYMNQELPDIQAGFRKDQIIFIGSQRNQRNSRNTSASLTTLKPLTVWITTNCGKFLRRRKYQIPYLFLEKSVCGKQGSNS